MLMRMIYSEQNLEQWQVQASGPNFNNKKLGGESAKLGKKLECSLQAATAVSVTGSKSQCSATRPRGPGRSARFRAGRSLGDSGGPWLGLKLVVLCPKWPIVLRAAAGAHRLARRRMSRASGCRNLTRRRPRAAALRTRSRAATVTRTDPPGHCCLSGL